MAKLYTLDEAAAKLGLAVDVFKRKLKTEWVKDIQMIPGNPPHFRAADIDEFARVLGAASDPGLQVGPVGSAPAEDSNDFSFALAEDAAPMPPKGQKRPRLADADEPLLVAVDDDIFTAPPPKPGKSGKSGSDSDVRLDPASGVGRRDASDDSLPTEEITIDLAGPSSAVIKPSGGSGRLSAPKSGTKLAGPESSKIPSPTKLPGGAKGDDSSSEFELSLDPSNDSLELEMAGDSSEEVDLGGLLLPSDAKGGQSGINLSRPADSGLSLERKAPKTGPMNLADAPADADSDVDFELSLDASPGGSSAGRMAGPRSTVSRSTGPDSDSEFELTLDDHSGISDVVASAQSGRGGSADNSQGDIFETDFELPSLEEESSSEVVAEGTDLAGDGFEIDASDMIDPNDDESASQVMVIDDGEPVLEDNARAKGRGGRRALADPDGVDLADDLEHGASASGALRGVRDDDGGDYRVAPAQTVVGAPAKWGALPAVVLFMTLPLMFMGAIMSYEMVRGMWGYHQPTQPGNLLVRGLAESIFSLKSGD